MKLNTKQKADLAVLKNAIELIKAGGSIVFLSIVKNPKRKTK